MKYGELKMGKAQLQSENTKISGLDARIRKWTKVIKSYLYIRELSGSLLLEMPNGIVVLKKTNKDGLDEQRIRILYRFAREKRSDEVE